MGERNPLGCYLEAAALARLPLHEASRGQIFRIQENHSISKSRGLLVETRFGIPAMKASSAEAGKSMTKTGKSRDLSHHPTVLLFG